jgi:tetratricopeptide (TPR) repeat protein
MTSLHQRAKEVFLLAVARPAADRPALLEEVCGNDRALRQEIESLLAYHDQDDASAPRASSTEVQFATGDVFAGRYRMIARLGRGGMGDVWHADDLVLETPVALKLIHSTPQGRERSLNEVRLARQITHPAVCRVFDVGEAEGTVFYSMELVRGEDLASLLRRVGRLPSEKVADIARQLCAGLAAAHAQGVLHRDLKPANVLIDEEGLVRITDFGIAIPRSDARLHMLTGTPGYMAPEQRTDAGPLTERTDLYALGLVLYECLVGNDAFSRADRHRFPRPSTLVLNVNPALERAIMRALAVDPHDRPSSALDMAAALPDIGTHRDTPLAPPARTERSRIPFWAAAAALASVVAIAAVVASFVMFPRAAPLNAQDTIVLAEFENTTGEPVFDGALKVALAVALEQSPFLKVFPDERARDTLRLMQRSPDERVTRTLAREIARREQFKALLAGSIAPLGRNYVITLEAINAQSGDVMAREQAEAVGKEQVLTSLGTAASKLRGKLGESLASIRAFDVQLPRATTASLEGLQAYSFALSDGREVPRLEAIPHLKRALEFDPTFAMAHALLSAVYTNTGQSALAPNYARTAFELRDRVSERERFFISWRYYRDATQAWDKALDLARSWTATYPREAVAFNSLGIARLRLGQFDQSVVPFREAIRLDPKFSPAYSNLAASLMALDRLDEARGVLQQAADLHLDFIGARRLSYLVAFVQGDTKTMARELEASTGVRETNSAYGWQAHTSAFSGRVSDAHEQFRRGIQMSLQGNYQEVAAQLTMEDAETHAIAGQCGEALREVPPGLALSRDNATYERASRALALCGAREEASSLASDVARRFPEAILSVRVAVPVTSAASALERGDAARALAMLDPVRQYDHVPSAEFWPSYLRGLAKLRLKDGDGAAAEFRQILNHRGEVPASMLLPLAHLGLARSAALTGDSATARKAYEDMFALWKDADAALQPLKDAQGEYARLQ